MRAIWTDELSRRVRYEHRLQQQNKQAALIAGLFIGVCVVIVVGLFS